MNYVCVSINRELVDYQDFGDKKQAIEYFCQQHGQAIYEKMQVLKEKYEKRILNYEVKIDKQKIKIEEMIADMEAKGDADYIDYETPISLEKKKLEGYQERQQKTKEQLEALKLDLSKKPVTYEVKMDYDDYPEKLIEEVPLLMLHVAGIYQKGNTFSVIEEKFSCVGAKSESNYGILEAIKKLPKKFDKNRIFLYALPEKDKDGNDNVLKLQKEVVRIRGQLQRNFENSPTRIKEMYKEDDTEIIF